MGDWWFDCPQCGNIDRADKMNAHPVRPMAMDLGFCPKCGGEIEELITETQVRELLDEYGDDADKFFAEHAA